MPETNRVEVTRYAKLDEWLGLLVGLLASFPPDSEAITSYVLEISEHDGHPAIHTSYDSSYGPGTGFSDHVESWALLSSVVSGDAVPADYVLLSPVLRSDFGASPGFGRTPSDLASRITDNVASLLVPAVIGLTGVELNLEAVRLAESDDDKRATVGVVLTGADDRGRVWCPAMSWQMVLNHTESSEESTSLDGGAGLGASGSPDKAISFSVPGLDRVADSLDAIAHTDVRIGLNNNRIIYQVTGGAVIRR